MPRKLRVGGETGARFGDTSRAMGPSAFRGWQLAERREIGIDPSEDLFGQRRVLASVRQIGDHLPNYFRDGHPRGVQLC